MLRRLFITIGLVAVLVGASLGTAHAATVPPGKWATNFCKALQKWQTTIEGESKAATDAFNNGTGDPKIVRGEFVDFLGKDVAATQTAIASIKKAGSPSSANGSKIQAKTISGFQSAATVFATAKTNAAALSTTDVTAFVSGATKIQQDLNAASSGFQTSFSAIAKLDKDNELNKALGTATACKFLQ